VHKETDLRVPATVVIAVVVDVDAMEDATLLNGRPEARVGSVDEAKGVLEEANNAVGMSLVDLLVEEEVIDAELLDDKSYSIIMAENCCCCR